MRWPPRSALLAAFALLLLPAAAAADNVPAGSKTLTSGPVTATLSWQSGDFVAMDARLQIARNGTQVLDADLTKQCQLCGTLGDPQDAMSLRDLDGDGEPEVLVDFYTGGAHCCAVTTVWYLKDPITGSYARRVIYTGNLGYQLRDLDGDGRPEIVTGDNSFAYAFTAFAFNFFPPLVYDWRAHSFVDVTRHFPKLVRADMARIRRALPGLRKHYDPRGAVAAYVADEFLLGRRHAGLKYLDAALRRGDLRAVPRDDTLWPSGRKFRPALLKFLKKNGYG